MTLTATPTTAIPPQTRRAAIAGTNIHKSYRAGNRTIEILHGIDLQVFEGELCAIMGPSGSGKSTLLYCLAGLELPTSGEVHLLDQPVKAMSRAKRAKMRRRDIGFVFQSYNLIPTLTAYENVALPYRLAGQRPPKQQILETLTQFGLGEMTTKRPTVMSGGEQQRVALARVLAADPRIIFADEPTGALDSHTGKTVLDELQKLAHVDGRCVLMVTHDPSVAATCDRVLFLRDGVLVDELTTPTEESVSNVMRHLDATRTKGDDR